MTRAATSPEVTKFASDGQWSDQSAYIPVPAVVLACRVNQAIINYDKLTQLGFDGVTAGAYGDVVPGQTVLVGSAAGLCDRGIGYARKAATSSILYFGETSGINPQDNDYITVLNEFGPWMKQASQPASDGTIKIDTDIVYTNQLDVRKGIISAGGDRVLELAGGGTVTAAYTLTGGASYVTTCPGGTVTSGTTSAPSIAVTAVGDYRVQIVGTSSGGAVTTTYRWIYVKDIDTPAKNVVVSDNSGDGVGWSAHVTVYENISSVRDRAKVILFAREYYGGVLGSIGSLPGCENVVHTGWIDGKSVVYDVDNGSVDFDVKSASWWLDQIQNAVEIKVNQVTATPANWKEMKVLTVDAMLWHILEHFTTVLNSMDAILTGDTRTVPTMTAPIGSLWSQITSIADGKIKALSFVNQYGQLVFTIDTPLIPIASRSGIPVVVTLTSDDWQDITVDVVQVNPNAQLIVTGKIPNGDTIASYGGGSDVDHYGSTNTIDNLIAATQAEMNVLAGSLFARDNTPYKFSITNLRGNNRLIEPGCRVGLTLSGSDNLAGVAYSGYMIVRSVKRTHDAETGANAIDIDGEAETEATRYKTGVIPLENGNGIPFPKLPPFTFPKFPFGGGGYPKPQPIIPNPSDCPDDSPATGPYFPGWDRSWIGGPVAAERSTFAWIKCTIRSSTAANPTVASVDIGIKEAAYASLLHIAAIDGGGAIAVTGTLVLDHFGGPTYASNFHVDFANVGAVAIAGFKLWIDEAYEPIVAYPVHCNTLVTTFPTADEWEGNITGSGSFTVAKNALSNNGMQFIIGGSGPGPYQTSLGLYIKPVVDSVLTGEVWCTASLVSTGDTTAHADVFPGDHTMPPIYNNGTVTWKVYDSHSVVSPGLDSVGNVGFMVDMHTGGAATFTLNYWFIPNGPLVPIIATPLPLSISNVCPALNA